MLYTTHTNTIHKFYSKMISREKLLLRHLDLNPQPSDQHFLTNLSYRDVELFARQRSGGPGRGFSSDRPNYAEPVHPIV